MSAAPIPGTPAREFARVSVVNMDLGWPFADLVRRFALDLRGPACSGMVEFRTISEKRHDPDASIWGANWPRAYGDDTESLLADLFEDLALLDERRLSRLTILLILPHPFVSKEKTADALGLARRLEERVGGSTRVRQNLRRIVLVRDTGATPSTELDAILGEVRADFLDDPTKSGRQLFDAIVTLRRPTVRTEDDEVQARQFALLRCVMTFADGNAERRTSRNQSVRVSSAIEFDRYLRGSVTSLDLQGNYPILTSEKIGKLLHAFLDQTIATSAVTDASARGQDGEDGQHETEVGVDRVLRMIDEDLVLHERTIAAVASGPQSWNSDYATYWTPEKERNFRRELNQDRESLESWSITSMIAVAERRKALQEAITKQREREVRQLVSGLVVANAGLSGEAAQTLLRLKEAVRRKRGDLLEASSRSRQYLLSIRVPSERVTAEIPQMDIKVKQLSLSNMAEYYEYLKASGEAMAKLRDLIPLRYIFLLPVLPFGALITILTFVWSRTPFPQGWMEFFDTLFSPFPVLLAAWGGAFLAGAWSVRRTVRARKIALDVAIEDLKEKRDALSQRVHSAMNGALNYVVLTNRIPWLDLLHNELDRRSAENDVNAFANALARIRPPAHRDHAILSTGEEENRFFKGHRESVARERVTRWLATIVDRIDPEKDYRAELIAIEASDGGVSFEMESTLFVEPATVLVTTLGTVAGEAN